MHSSNLRLRGLNRSWIATGGLHTWFCFTTELEFNVKSAAGTLLPVTTSKDTFQYMRTMHYHFSTSQSSKVQSITAASSVVKNAQWKVWEHTLWHTRRNTGEDLALATCDTVDYRQYSHWLRRFLISTYPPIVLILSISLLIFKVWKSATIAGGSIDCVGFAAGTSC